MERKLELSLGNRHMGGQGSVADSDSYSDKGFGGILLHVQVMSIINRGTVVDVLGCHRWGRHG